MDTRVMLRSSQKWQASQHNSVSSEDETDTAAEQGADSSSFFTAISNGQAVKMLAWLQQQDEASAYNLSVLRDRCELAAKKWLSSVSQKHLTDYFSA